MRLDHLVYATTDLEASVSVFESRLGVAPRPGGRHPGLGTRNAILPLGGESYVELIALDREGPRPTGPAPFGLDALEGPRLVTWAVRSRDIERDVERSRDRGYDPGAILAMNRTEPSGAVLRWHLAIRRDAFGEGLVPFVIDWGDSPHPSVQPDGRVPACRLSRFGAVHPRAASIREARDALGVEFEIAHAAQPGLTACLEGPFGGLDLE